MKKQKRHVGEKGRLKPDGKLNPKDVFNMTKKEECAFRKAAFEEKQQKERGMDFKIGEAGLKIRYVRSLFSSLR